MSKTESTMETLGGAPWWLSNRLWLAFLAFLGFVFVYTQRVGMSVAIVCMVNQTALSEDRIQQDVVHPVNSSNQTNVPYSFNNSLEATHGECKLNSMGDGNHMNGPFVWSKSLQGHVLGSFFYGYLVSQVPAGMLAQRFGGKWVFTAFYLVCTVGTLLTPLAARLHFSFLIAVRVLVGIGSGGIFPTMHSVWAKWAPPMERSRLAGISYAGAMMGNVVAMPLSGLLCEHGFDGGWASVFYVFGILSMMWLFLWVFIVSDTPATCRYISHREKSYILDSLEGQSTSKQENKFHTPWLSILKSPPVWAIVIANFTSDWGLYTLLTNIPTYMYEVLKFDVQANGMFSAFPFLGLWANMNLSPVIADKLRSSGVLSTGTTRKLFNSIGHLGASVFLIGLAFVDCSHPLIAVGLLTCGVAISGSSYSGFLVNHMDIAPQYAGILFGLTNCLAAISGFIAPTVAALLTENQSREEWQHVFFLAAGIYALGAVVYAVFASGELQPWAFDRGAGVLSDKVVINENNSSEKQAMLTENVKKDKDSCAES